MYMRLKFDCLYQSAMIVKQWCSACAHVHDQRWFEFTFLFFFIYLYEGNKSSIFIKNLHIIYFINNRNLSDRNFIGPLFICYCTFRNHSSWLAMHLQDVFQLK